MYKSPQGALQRLSEKVLKAENKTPQLMPYEKSTASVSRPCRRSDKAARKSTSAQNTSVINIKMKMPSAECAIRKENPTSNVKHEER